jgi:GDP-mannose 6-dehydrogenase
MKIAVFGMGYVGCVTAACLSRDGHDVIGADIDASKVDELNRGAAPVSEPGLTELVAAQTRDGRLRATTSVDEAVRGSELALVAVGTPSTADGAVGTRAVRSVIASIGQSLRGATQPYCVVVRSTLLPGILEEELSPLLERESGRRIEPGDLALCNNPEFLRESCAIEDHDHPPFIIIGAASVEQAQPLIELYRGQASNPIVTDTRTAAMVKYACNAFHALKVAFANEIGSIAKLAGADGHKVMDLLCGDRKLNISRAYLRPGFAFGGSCLPKDLRAITRLVEQRGVELDLIPSILPSNRNHINRGIAAIVAHGQQRVGLIGLSFKKDTDDLRESPLVTLAESMIGRGFDVRIYDPCVQTARLRGRNLAYVDRHLPHLARLLVTDPQDLFDHAQLLVLGSQVADSIDLTNFHSDVLDLRRDLAIPGPALPDEEPGEHAAYAAAVHV